MQPHSQSKCTAFHGNHIEWFDSIWSVAPSARLSQPCPHRSWPTLGSWLLPRCCTCWARPDAAAPCRPGPDCTAACREGPHPPSEEVQNKPEYKHTQSTYYTLRIKLWNKFLESGTMKGWSYSKCLGVDSNCLMLPPEVEQKVLQGMKVVQMADCCVDHKHHLGSRDYTHTTTEGVQGHARVQIVIL